MGRAGRTIHDAGFAPLFLSIAPAVRGAEGYDAMERDELAGDLATLGEQTSGHVPDRLEGFAKDFRTQIAPGKLRQYLKKDPQGRIALMSRYLEFDPSELEVVPFSSTPHTVYRNQFAKAPMRGASFAEFWRSLPQIHAGSSVRTVAQRLAEARRRDRAIVVACGGHVVKCGLGPVLIALMREGFISAIAMNGATAIHDIEVALFGETSELVEQGLQSGRFGMACETAEFHIAALAAARAHREGAGEAFGRMLCERDAPFAGDSLLASAYADGIPVTVHVAIGTDIVHMHASADGAALGDASMRDFRILTAAMRGLSSGGVLLNIGSAVILPEVVLKAIASLRNADAEFGGFLGVNLDMIQHYRANSQIVDRLRAIGGEGISLTGHHEIMVPLLAFAVLDASAELADEDRAAARPRHSSENRAQSAG